MVAPDVLREVVERAGREDRERASGIDPVTAAPHATVPSPPPTPEYLGPFGCRADTFVMLSFSVSSTISAFGSSRRTSPMTRAPVPLPEAGLTTRTTPVHRVEAAFRCEAARPTGACARRSVGPGAHPGLRSTRRCRSPPRHHWDSGHRLPRGIPRPGPQEARLAALASGVPSRRLTAKAAALAA